MVARTTAPVAANAAVFADNRRAGETALPGEGQALTSHTWSLSSGGLCLDFTYRRLESLSAPAGRQPAPAAQPTAAQSAAPKTGRRPSFQEMLRRQQLAQLLVEPSRPPRERQALFAPQLQAEPLAGPVCRAYAQALGPLGAASRSYTA
ncbi:MAG: hypothetical protein ACOZHQ_11885 [Thermodesulfobacteriota bacterium]